MIPVLAVSILAYLLGTVPFGLLIARRVRGIDIREHGSKNIGATNVFRVVGKPWGILVFVLDVLKGALAVRLAAAIAGEDAFLVLLGAGMLAIGGHTFPVWLKFRGGKGVATSLGVFLALLWVPTLITFGVWLVTFAVSRIISLSSLVAAIAFPAVIYFLCSGHPDFPVIQTTGFIVTVFMFYTHRANISRLRRGEEKKLF